MEISPFGQSLRTFQLSVSFCSRQSPFSLKLTHYLAPVSWCSTTSRRLAVGLPLDDACCWLPLAAAGCRWLLKTRDTEGLELTARSWNISGDVDCRTSFIAGVSEAVTVVVRSLFSMLKLFLLEEQLIGVCSLLTSIQVLGS